MLARRLKILRQSKSLTQKQIAEMLHIDRSTYAYYETGKAVPDIRTLLFLSAFYRVSIDDMVGNPLTLHRGENHHAT